MRCVGRAGENRGAFVQEVEENRGAFVQEVEERTLTRPCLTT